MYDDFGAKIMEIARRIRFNEKLSGDSDFNSFYRGTPTWVARVDAQTLAPGEFYRLCVDLDGTQGALQRLGDSGFAVRAAGYCHSITAFW